MEYSFVIDKNNKTLKVKETELCNMTEILNAETARTITNEKVSKFKDEIFKRISLEAECGYSSCNLTQGVVIYSKKCSNTVKALAKLN